MPAVCVIAKEPAPGRVKTRLSPALSPVQAAELALASLQDTLESVRAVGGVRHVLCLEGSPGPWAEGFEVLPQRGGGDLDTRLAALAQDVGEAFVVVGMDTPGVTPALLRAALAAPATIGMATDGGYWGLGLHEPDPHVFLGVPMSRAETGALQLARLRERGHDPVVLPSLHDFDEVGDLDALTASVPGTRVAAAWARMRSAG